jgi:hypothetical protein
LTRTAVSPVSSVPCVTSGWEMHLLVARRGAFLPPDGAAVTHGAGGSAGWAKAGTGRGRRARRAPRHRDYGG